MSSDRSMVSSIDFSVLPTPLADAVDKLRSATDEKLGASVSEAFQKTLDFAHIFAVAAYLREGIPRPELQQLLFGAIGNSKGLRSLSFLHQAAVDGFHDRGLGGRLAECWRSLEAWSDSSGPVLPQLMEHGRYSRHVLSLHAEASERSRQVVELLHRWGKVWGDGSIFATWGERVWEFRGTEPLAASAPSRSASVPAIWWQAPGGDVLDLSALLAIEAEATDGLPHLVLPSDEDLAMRLRPAVEASPTLSSYYTRYCNELEGRFAFVPRVGTLVASAAAELKVRDLLGDLAIGRPLLVHRPPPFRDALGWVEEALQAAGHRVLTYRVSESPIAQRLPPFLKWLWRQVTPEGASIPADPRNHLPALSRYCATSGPQRIVLLLDDLHFQDEGAGRGAEPGMAVLSAALLKLDGLGIICFADPVRMDSVPGLQRRFWSAADLLPTADAEPWTESEALADMTSRVVTELDRQIVCAVAGAEESVPVADLAAALRLFSPVVQAAAQRLSPLWVCPQGLTNLEEGFTELAFWSKQARAAARRQWSMEWPDIHQRLLEAISRRQDSVGRRQQLALREAPPRHVWST